MAFWRGAVAAGVVLGVGGAGAGRDEAQRRWCPKALVATGVAAGLHPRRGGGAAAASAFAALCR